MDQVPLLIVVSGPSGTGKGAIRHQLLDQLPDVVYSVSCTTRNPRPGEQNGKDYFFLTKEEFLKLKQAGEFLEAAEVYGDYYGTPRRQVEQALREGKDVLLEIDTEGARQVRAIYPDGVFIFIAPPSLQELRNRILKRGTEPEEVMERRLMLAKSELERMREYDYVVVNNEVHQAVATIKAIITAEKCRSRRVAFLLSSSL